MAPSSSSTNPLLTSTPQQTQNASSPLDKEKAIDSDAEIMAAHSIVADQQRRIRQLEKDLCESQAEIQRLRAANLDMERRQPKKAASIKNVEAASKATPLGPSPSSTSAMASSTLATPVAAATTTVAVAGSAVAASPGLDTSSAPILSLTATPSPAVPSNHTFQTPSSPPSHVPAETQKASMAMAMAITSVASPASKRGAATSSAKKQQSDEAHGFGNGNNTATNSNYAIANSANTSTKNTTPGTKAATAANTSAYSIASPFELDNEKGDQKSSRYWTPEEHDRFLDGLKIYGSKDIKNIAKHVGTRNATQVRTHAQKYYLRLSREAMRAQVPMGSGDSPSESPSIPMHIQSSPLIGGGGGGGDFGLSMDDATTSTPALNSEAAVPHHTAISSKDADGGQPKSSPKRAGAGAALSRRKSDVASALAIAKMDTSTDMVSMGSGSAASGPMIGNLTLNASSDFHLGMAEEDGAYPATSLVAGGTGETLPAYAVMAQQQQLQAGFVPNLAQEQQTRSRASKPGRLKAARQDSVSPGYMAATPEEQGSKKKQTKGSPDIKMAHASYAVARSSPVMTSATGKRTRSKKIVQQQQQQQQQQHLNAYDADVLPEMHTGHSHAMELASASSMPVSLSQEMANAALDDDMVLVTSEDHHHGHDHDHHIHPHQELHSGLTPSKDLLEAHSLHHQHHHHSSGAGQGVSLDPDHEHHHGFGIGLDDAFDHDHDHDPSSVIADLEDSGRLFGDDQDAGEHDEHLRPRHGDTLDVPGSERLYHHGLHPDTGGESMHSGSSGGMESSAVVEHPRAVILENRHSFGSLAVLSEELDDS
eukprot:CAMPEP_0184691702 /NCGR_PEP_ID=MMETSP0313-20130426/468_1 /TAXON_ID=2792 /ORGANISM="Porphyridium aerugineum, Strain SAG 1380-2" /LENGTH=821 /DNA_ID=CAMNT_0027149461 /DNA_START=823 /DNA_END=3288 /DNA_ORIENTATION=-